MLAAPEESKGTFSYAAPDKVRWEYTSPSPITVVIRGDEMTTWYRDLKRAETLKVGPLLEPGLQVPGRQRQPADAPRVLHACGSSSPRRRATPTAWSSIPSTRGSPSG